MWQNKVVIVTGSSRGIGKKLAEELGRKGANIVLNGSNKSVLEQAKDELLSTGLSVSSCQGDISDFVDCQKVVDHTIFKFGRIDALINNAGICSKSNLDEIQPEVFKKIIDVNLTGSVYMTKAALPYIKRTKGSILFIGSIAGIHGIGDYSAYSSSKAALKTIVESLRIELCDHKVYVGYANVGFTENDPQKTFLDKNGDLIPVPSRKEIKQEPVRTVAARLIKMIERKRSIQTFSFIGKLNDWVSRISPDLVHRILLRSYVNNKY